MLYLYPPKNSRPDPRPSYTIFFHQIFPSLSNVVNLVFTLVYFSFNQKICSFVKDVVNHQFKPKAVWVLSGVYFIYKGKLGKSAKCFSHTDSVGFGEG